MNPTRIEIRNETAAGSLEVCKELGDLIEYWDRKDDSEKNEPLKLWAIPATETRELVKEGAVEEERTHRDFFVPRQCCFPPDNEPSANARIRYEGHDWAVTDWKRDSVGAAYRLMTTRHQPRRSTDA
jgi:hypothetical protein